MGAGPPPLKNLPQVLDRAGLDQYTNEVVLWVLRAAFIKAAFRHRLRCQGVF